MVFGFLTSDNNARGWVSFLITPWQCSCRLMVLETADHDSSSSSSNRKGRRSVSRLDREKDESSDWGRESISMVTTVMFFSPSPHPHLYPSHLLLFFFLPLLMSLSLAVTPSVICSWFLTGATHFLFAAFD